MKSAAKGTRGNGATKFDALKFAAGSRTLEGELDATEFSRIAERLVPRAAGKLRWRITGGQDEQKRPVLTLNLDGTLPVTCQRCLKPMAWPIAQQTMVLVARDEAELARLDANPLEVVLAKAPLDAAQLVEDELLLSLPYAPRHAEGCAADIPVAAAQRAKPAAMAKLAALKRNID